MQGAFRLAEVKPAEPEKRFSLADVRPAIAEDTPEGDAGLFPTLWQGAKTAAEQTGKGLYTLGKGVFVDLPLGIGQLATHPIDTVRAMGDAQGEQLDEAKAAYQRGDYSETVRHGLGYALPMVGPALVHAGDQLKAGNIGEGIAETLLQTPLPYKWAGQAIGAVTSPARLEASAAKNIANIMKPGMKTSGAKSGSATLRTLERVTPGLAQDKMVAGSIKGLTEQAKNRLDTLNTRIAYDKLPSVPHEDMLSVIDKLQQDRVNIPGTSTPGSDIHAAALDKIRNKIVEMATDPSNPEGPAIPAKSLQGLISDLDAGLVSTSGEYGQQAASTAKGIEKQAAARLREYRNRTYPAQAPMMEKAHELVKLKQALEQRADNIKLGKEGTLKESAKALMNMRPLKAAFTVTRLAGNVPWNTLSAAAKQSLAKAIRTADTLTIDRILGAGTSARLKGEGGFGGEKAASPTILGNTEPIDLIAPDGTIKAVPAHEADHYIKRGARPSP